MIVTSHEHDAVLSDGSATTYSTIVVPGPKNSPELCELLTTLMTPELSVACGVSQVMTAPPLPRGMVCEMSLEQTSTGFWVSTV